MNKIIILLLIFLIYGCCSLPFIGCHYEYKYQEKDGSLFHNFIINDSIIIMMEAELYELNYNAKAEQITCTIHTTFKIYNESVLPLFFTTSEFDSRLYFKSADVSLEKIYPAFDTILYTNSHIIEKDLFLEYHLNKKDNFFNQEKLILDIGKIQLNETFLNTAQAEMNLKKIIVKY